MHHIGFLGWQLPVPLADTIACIIAVIAALAVHWLVYAVLRRLVRRSSTSSDDIVLSQAWHPLRWICVALALALVRLHLHLVGEADAAWRQGAGLLLPAMLGWLAIAMLRAMQRIVEIRTDITVADNLAARRRRTRSAILGRIAIFLVAFVTICLMLLSIPAVRAVGVTLMASAGLAGLAVGAAAQPALKNLIAGIQMAFTEPIRIDDVVIVENEWGRIEEIRLTYVVVKIWDERRLIVPVSRFLEQPFENWTRANSQLLGTSFFYLDPTADLVRLRTKFEETVKADPRWDGRVMTLAVTDIREQVIEVRALVSAADSGRQFDLRTAIREKLLAFIRDEMPEALPRRRAELVPHPAG
ncbi:mechanosensitive ion channel family protein [Hephaestia mangrovi]|uniref:mechanosensitive ion channel family protein n=1 Tax=Hephaestia mangrovi TaxID=2873268 RepID=UPI001CA71AAC|nr:mechanosensitive ion channel domain-containing protein [Hephaestia mangrovi]MBY8827852.1 mechanosensitive ion channel family protein [Hephaestia mangrovi]